MASLLRMEPVGEWAGELVRALRIALRLTQEGFAEHLGMAPRTVRQWEAGRPVSLGAQEVLDGALAGASAEQQARFRMLRIETREEDQVKRRELLKLGVAGVAVAASSLTPSAPGSVAPELIGYFRAQLDGHYRTDMLLGPHQLIATVVAQYRVIGELTATATVGARRHLLALGVAYAALAGWLWQDAGDLAQSAAWRGEALEMAHRCGDPQLVGYSLTNLAMLRADLRDGPAVIALASSVLANERALSPKVRVMAMVHAAHGHALLGQRDQCDRALDGAARLVDLIDDDALWGNACRRTPGYLEIQRATCYGRMGLAAQAVDLWDELLTRVPPSSRRDYGVYRARQGAALAVAREPEQAVRVAAAAAGLVAETGSARMRAELLTLREGMAPWRHEAPGHELDELLVGITKWESK